MTANGVVPAKAGTNHYLIRRKDSRLHVNDGAQAYQNVYQMG